MLRALLAIRPLFFVVSLTACLLGIAGAHADGVEIRLAPVLLTLLLTAMIHAGGNILNDYYDYLSGADTLDPHGGLPPFTGGRRFIIPGKLSPAATRNLGYALLVLVIPGGLWLTATSGYGVLLIGLIGIALTWGYTAPPLKLIYRGLGELTIATCWLLVTIGADYVQRHSFALAPVLTGLPYALLVAALLTINQFPDRKGDTLAGKRTLVVLLGPATAASAYLLLALAAYMWVILMTDRGHFPQTAALAVLPCIATLVAARHLYAHLDAPQALAPAIRLTILAALAHGLTLSLILMLTARQTI